MAQAITRFGFTPIQADQRPDPTRIGALGATMALNLGALLVLAMPMQAAFTGGLSLPRDPPIIEILPEKAPPLPPPMPPVPVRRASTERTPAPTPPPQVPVEGGNQYVDVAPMPPGPTLSLPSASQPSGSPAGTGSTGSGPATLAYLQAPPPPYPRAAIRQGLTGTVWLLVRVDAEGRPVEVTVERGSGHRVLDDAARRQVLQHWRFQPALVDGQAVPAWGRIPIDFSLTRG
jgi:periplasmic protein TonB